LSLNIERLVFVDAMQTPSSGVGNNILADALMLAHALILADALMLADAPMLADALMHAMWGLADLLLEPRHLALSACGL
jgi:hypothetical protein